MKSHPTIIVLLLVTSLLSLCSLTITAQDSWMGTWAAAAEYTGTGDMPQTPLDGHTLRQVIRVSVGGDSIRLRLSNEFGDQPVRIKAVYVADALDSCEIIASTVRYLSFDGHRQVVIPAGGTVQSDVCRYGLRALQRLSVTIQYASSPQHATSHRGSRTTSYIAAGAVKPKSRFATVERVDHWYNIAAIEVPAHGRRCIAVLGNSITDGRGSTTNAQNRWPDRMAEALDGQVGVLNLGIGGNCVLAGGLSEPAVKRFDRDILGQCGVTDVIIFQGTNDIGGSSGNSEQVAAQLTDAYKGFVARLHDRGIRVIGATITPFKGNGWYSYFHEAARRTVNDWILGSGTYDAVIDFDAVLRDPDDSERIRDQWQEDGLHPNAAGYEVMGRAAADVLKSLYDN